MRQSTSIPMVEIVSIKGQYSAAALPAITARVARAELQRVLEVAPAPYQSFVDNIPSAQLEGVRPGGNIRFEFERHGIALDWIYQQLLDRSPVKTGNYREHHRLYIDGVQVSVSENQQPIELARGSEAVFLDLTPYARKIERGLSTLAPNGVYEITAKEAQARFRSVNISFHYMPLSSVAAGELPAPLPPFFRHPRHQPKEHAGADLGRRPAIVVRWG